MVLVKEHACSIKFIANVIVYSVLIPNMSGIASSLDATTYTERLAADKLNFRKAGCFFPPHQNLNQ